MKGGARKDRGEYGESKEESKNEELTRWRRREERERRNIFEKRKAREGEK